MTRGTKNSRTRRAHYDITRRGFLTYSTALATCLPIGRHLARAADRQPFTLGIASGEPTPGGFGLGTRLAPSPLAPDGPGGLFEPVPVLWEGPADDAL